jgi:toxin CptA
MNGAPAVRFAVKRSAFYAGLLLALWVIAACFILFWINGSVMAPVSSTRSVPALMAVVISGAWGLTGWLTSPVGDLQWDGGVWRFESAGPAPRSDIGRVHVAIDLQWVMLVRFQAANGPHWLWLAQSDDAGQWFALRRAVVSAKSASDSADAPTGEGRAA